MMMTILEYARKMLMKDNELLDLAKEEGFAAALIDVDQIPIEPSFRAYCEENLCGKYGANYSCPPDCGTVEELREKLMRENRALIVQTVWSVESYDDIPAVEYAKKSHNNAVLRLADKMRKLCYEGFCSGYNGCPICDPCKLKDGLPCAHPEKQISCMSAYCIDVAKLAKRCGLEFAWTQGKLYLYGMVAFHEA